MTQMFYLLTEVEKELGKKGKKLTLGSIQQAPELPTKTRTKGRPMEKDGDSPGEHHVLEETVIFCPRCFQLPVSSVLV